MGNWSHIGTVCLQHQPIQRHALRQIFTQMTTLERAYATHAKHETWEAQQLFRLPGIARKTMENATSQLLLIRAQEGDHLVLRLTAMYHQGQAQLYGPLHLFLKSQELLPLIFPTPIIIQSHFANSYKLASPIGKIMFMEMTQSLSPIRFHLFWMKSHHGISVTWIQMTDIEHLGN